MCIILKLISYKKNWCIWETINPLMCVDTIPDFIIFVMAKIQRIGHDHQAPFLFLLLFLDFKHDTRRKEAATCTIHPGPPIFLHILDPL